MDPCCTISTGVFLGFWREVAVLSPSQNCFIFRAHSTRVSSLFSLLKVNCVLLSEAFCSNISISFKNIGSTSLVTFHMTDNFCYICPHCLHFYTTKYREGCSLMLAV